MHASQFVYGCLRADWTRTILHYINKYWTAAVADADEVARYSWSDRLVFVNLLFYEELEGYADRRHWDVSMRR